MTEELEAAIGKALLSFNAVETKLRVILVHLLGPDFSAAMMLVYDSSAVFEWVRRQLDGQVAQRVDSALSKDWHEFLERVGEVQRERHHVAHDLWVELDSETLKRVRLRVTRVEQEYLKGDYVRELDRRISDRFSELVDLQDRLQAAGLFYSAP